MILKFHAQVQFIKGYLRTAIYDLPRKEYDFMPNEVYNQLKKIENHEKDLIYKICSEDELNWLNFLLKKEYVFFVPSSFKNNFPKIDFEWKTSSLITNAVVDIDHLQKEFVFKFLENLNCKHIALNFSFGMNFKKLKFFYETNLSKLTFNSISFFFPIGSVSEKDFSNYISIANNIHIVDFLPKRDKSDVFVPQFVLGINSFSESLEHNLYFNRKIRVSSNNGVFNGLEGDINYNKSNSLNSEDDLIKIINESEISKLWNVKKDDIDVCKDCEFRYMCIDNRILENRYVNSYYSLKECSYNPYISKWSNDKDFLSLKECGVIVNEKGIEVDFDKISSLNVALWGK